MFLNYMDKETVNHILNVLRHGTTTWHVRNECLNRHRRQRPNGFTLKGKPKFLWEHPCDSCGQWFLMKDNLLQVDHIEDVGTFDGNFQVYVMKMYCDPSNLQNLCKLCHDRKTATKNASLKYERKSLRDALDQL